MKLFEVYALVGDRTRLTIELFQRHFAVSIRKCASEYEFPLYSDRPEVICHDDRAILERLERSRFADYQLYWDVIEPVSAFNAAQLIAVYTGDGSVILGVVAPEQQATAILKELREKFGAEWGMVTGEWCPPDRDAEFQERCVNACSPRIVAGTLLH
jgi:hypothetical protein